MLTKSEIVAVIRAYPDPSIKENNNTLNSTIKSYVPNFSQKLDLYNFSIH